MSVPKEVTIATVEAELPGISSYVQRHGWAVTWDADTLRLIFLGQHPADKAEIRLISDVQGYRAIAPAWTFENPLNGVAIFPKAGTGGGISQSIFHNSNVICAPFNRLAYKIHGGPHSDWGGPECWLNVHNYVHETTLAGMFAIIIGHLKVSSGMNK